MLSHHLFFITERISDIFKLEEEKKVELWWDESIRVSVHELREELSRVIVYVRDVEQRPESQQHDYDSFYLELCAIANSSDDILNRIFRFSYVHVNDTYGSIDAASVINGLIDRIRNSHRFLPFGSNYIINIVGNTNLSGKQIINYDPSLSRAPIINPISRPKTYATYPDPDLVGFEHEIQTLLHHLIQDNETSAVVGIVGMGGIGKTTLAKHIYHHSKINTRFASKIWVCISQSWDATSILNAIWRQAAKAPDAAKMDYDQVVDRLSQLLSSQSYFLVLDDMWCIDAWNHISPAFPPRSNGSRVVVTSRIMDVAKRFGPSVHIVEPKPLDAKESWELFEKKAFLPNENISDMLLQMGKQMVKECHGLPLAIVALAGILGMDKRPFSWDRVSKTLRLNILKEENQLTQGVVNEVLALSYHELPHYLKQCALYLRLFPEDFEIDAERLVKMWIAEGFINTNEDPESIAEQYLDKIVQRYIVIVVKMNYMGQAVRIRIHDLFGQMFEDIAQKRGLFNDPLRLALDCRYGYRQNSNAANMSESQSIANLERILGTKTNSQVRSIIIFLGSSFFSAENILLQLFTKFRLLRVLILCGERMSQEVIMPQEISNLIHLRYLELGGGIQPAESIENLGNLWTLNMRGIIWMKKMPWNVNLCKLKELRHLYLPRDLRFQSNLELGKLKKLKTLWNVRGGGRLLSTMPVLSDHLLMLDIFINPDLDKVKSVEQPEMVFRTPSITWNNLQNLELNWTWNSYELQDMVILSKCESLTKLKLFGRIKAGTPIVFPPNLIKLTLGDTYLKEREVMNLINKSCPHLKILGLRYDTYVGSELVCNANSFLQLEKLKFQYQKKLRMWIIETSAMRRLHHLTLDCHEDMDLNTEGWKIISNIPQLTYVGYEDIFAKKLRVYRKDDQNLSQSSYLNVRGTILRRLLLPRSKR